MNVRILRLLLSFRCALETHWLQSTLSDSANASIDLWGRFFKSLRRRVIPRSFRRALPPAPPEFSDEDELSSPPPALPPCRFTSLANTAVWAAWEAARRNGATLTLA